MASVMRSALLALVLCVAALVLEHAHALDAHSAQYLRSRELADADDAAACAAAASSSPFAVYLTALPETGGLRACASANINDLVAALSAKDSKCPLATLVSLVSSSSTDKDMAAFSELLSALLSGVASSSSNATAAASLPTFLASWSKDASKTQGFCTVMNTKVGPCAQTLVPALLGLLRKGPKCCSGLAQYVDVLNLIAPAGKSVEQTLFDLLNGLHATLCTSVSGGSDAGPSLCGQRLMTHLASATASGDATAKSLLTAVVFDAGLPLYALPDTGACAALETTAIPSRVLPTATIPYFAASCCTSGLLSLLQAIDASLARITSSSVVETLNLITAKQSATAASQFRAFYADAAKCSFAQTCSPPAFVLPTNVAIATTAVANATATAAKTMQPQRVACTKVDVCDAEKVCSSVCKPGSVAIAPWAARALSFQRNQSYTKSLCFTQLPGTHNSATTLARGYGNRDQLLNKVLDPANANSYVRTNNQVRPCHLVLLARMWSFIVLARSFSYSQTVFYSQFLSLEDQLRIGARFLEIDVHYFGGAIRSGHCSGISLSLITDASATLVAKLTAMLSTKDAPAVVEWDASLFGCLPSLSGIRADEQRLHKDSLTEVATWLKANPTELVVLYTEIGDELARFSKTAALLELYTATFGDLAFTPADLKAKGGDWTAIPLSDLIQANKRVILVTTPKENALMFKMTSLCDGWSDVPSARGAGSSGATLYGKTYNSGRLVRAYQSALRYATLSERDLQGSSAANASSTAASPTDPTDVTAATLPTFVNAGVNVLAPDGLDGATMEAMVWSWAPKEPSSGDTAVEVAAKDGRWYGVADKAAIPNVACVSASDRSAWKIVAQGAACPSGFAPGAPVLAIENTALVTALRAVSATATAQLAVDVSKFPAISAADEKAFESAMANSSGGTSGGASGSSTPTGNTSAGLSSVRQTGASATIGLAALAGLWLAVVA